MIDKIHIKRSKQKVFLYTGLVLWLIGINLYLFKTYNTSNTKSSLTNSIINTSIYDQSKIDNQKEEEEKLKEENNNKNNYKDDITIKILQTQLQQKPDRRNLDFHASIYDQIFKNHEVDSIYLNLDFKDRCDLFFKNLFINNHNWIFNPNDKYPLENKNEFKFNDYKRVHFDEFKNEFSEKFKKNKDEVDESIPEFKQFIQEKYQQFWDRTMHTEQKIINEISALRIFNKCYITNDNKTQTNQMNSFTTGQSIIVDNLRKHSNKDKSKFITTKQENLINFDSIDSHAFEHRLYPWLSNENPIFEHFTGHRSYVPPKIRQDYKRPTIKSPYFLKNYKNQCNGRGIVLSIGDAHVEDTVRLIHLLRGLNNQLPIQIVYYDNLSTQTKKKIVTAAQEPILALPKSFEAVYHHFPNDYIANGLPKQEIWFVNTYNVIHNDFKEKFRGYANKFLATLFNSFEEFMLIDADTVMMQNPEYFFNLKGYKQTGTFFYKDRTTFETRPMSDTIFFKKLGPSILDSTMFNIPIMTEKTYKNDFFKGLFHYQESGLVMLNRNIHYNSILMMLQLNFYEPVNSRIHGDKEIFWLALTINGFEDFAINSNYAAAIGEITPPLDRAKSDGKPHESIELCSPHPGHISDEDNALVWINSGFYFCGQSKKVDFQKESEHKSRLKFLKTKEDFKAFYYSPLIIKSAIIPPLDLNVWATNKDDEPSRGWFMDQRYCSGYMWCAYSSIGGQTDKGGNNKRIGRLFDFSEAEQNLFKYYGDIWVNNE
ncbi:unnamed protein product [Candida verbasci]|uniref:Alpha-1,3-mannosyltransferase n=1 Tax=Candida verbasci TaxID=1227364 RepID=A0A9W4XCM6_9ASCO|nr:unnamed protein product [Candida verbasci]